MDVGLQQKELQCLWTECLSDHHTLSSVIEHLNHGRTSKTKQHKTHLLFLKKKTHAHTAVGHQSFTFSENMTNLCKL